MLVPPLVKDMQDAAVQSEPLSVSEEKGIQVPASAAGEVLSLTPGVKFCFFLQYLSSL